MLTECDVALLSERQLLRPPVTSFLQLLSTPHFGHFLLHLFCLTTAKISHSLFAPRECSVFQRDCQVYPNNEEQFHSTKHFEFDEDNSLLGATLFCRKNFQNSKFPTETSSDGESQSFVRPDRAKPFLHDLCKRVSCSSHRPQQIHLRKSLPPPPIRPFISPSSSLGCIQSTFLAETYNRGTFYESPNSQWNF